MDPVEELADVVAADLIDVGASALGEFGEGSWVLHEETLKTRSGCYFQVGDRHLTAPRPGGRFCLATRQPPEILRPGQHLSLAVQRVVRLGEVVVAKAAPLTGRLGAGEAPITPKNGETRSWRRGYVERASDQPVLSYAGGHEQKRRQGAAEAGGSPPNPSNQSVFLTI